MQWYELGLELIMLNTDLLETCGHMRGSKKKKGQVRLDTNKTIVERADTRPYKNMTTSTSVCFNIARSTTR